MSHKYSSSTFSGGCGTARNSKEFLSLDIARDSEYHNIWYFITYNCNIWYMNIHLPHSMAGAELSTAGNSKEFLSLDIARDSESLKLDRFINLLFSVLVLSTPLLPILTNTKKQKKGKGKWCKWCVNNTCVWSKANSWFGLCVFIRKRNLPKLLLLSFLTKEKQALFVFVCCRWKIGSLRILYA